MLAPVHDEWPVLGSDDRVWAFWYAPGALGFGVGMLWADASWTADRLEFVAFAIAPDVNSAPFFSKMPLTGTGDAEVEDHVAGGTQVIATLAKLVDAVDESTGDLKFELARFQSSSKRSVLMLAHYLEGLGILHYMRAEKVES